MSVFINEVLFLWFCSYLITQDYNTFAKTSCHVQNKTKIWDWCCVMLFNSKCIDALQVWAVVCRRRLTATDVSNVITLSAKFIDSILASFDRDETELFCTDSSVGQVCCGKTAEENNVRDTYALVIHRIVEILTEYLRLLRNACANYPCHQTVIHS